MDPGQAPSRLKTTGSSLSGKTKPRIFRGALNTLLIFSPYGASPTLNLIRGRMLQMLSREQATPEQLKLINEIHERKKESAQKAAEEQSKIDLRELNEAIALIYDRDESFHLNAFGQKIQEFLKANQDDQAFQEIRSPFVFNLQNAYPEHSSYAFFANYKRRSIESFLFSEADFFTSICAGIDNDLLILFFH